MENYKGKRSGGGMNGETVIVILAMIITAMLLLTMKANSSWSGMDVSEQVHQAVFVTKDWE